MEHILTNHEHKFICYCIPIILNKKKYVLAPNVFTQAFFGVESVTPSKVSTRHGYCLCPTEYAGDAYTPTPCHFKHHMSLRIQGRNTLFIAWRYRPNGTYVASLVHPSDPRRNGCPVLNDKSELMGMYLSTDWLTSKATVLPIDVVTDAPSIDINPMYIHPTGYVHGCNNFLANKSSMRIFDIQAEHGRTHTEECVDGETVSSAQSPEPVPPLVLPSEMAIECLGMLFVQHGNKVRCVQDWAGGVGFDAGPLTVWRINHIEAPNIHEFANEIRTMVDVAVIEWVEFPGGGHRLERVERNVYFQGIEINDYVTIWNETDSVPPSPSSTPSGSDSILNYSPKLLEWSGSPESPEPQVRFAVADNEAEPCPADEEKTDSPQPDVPDPKETDKEETVLEETVREVVDTSTEEACAEY